jgi:16S rRNA (cytosine1402-N4)-methyltransferase
LNASYHVPVLLHECVDGLNVKHDGIYVDATFGGGGHSRELLKKIKAGKLIGFDQDTDAMRNSLTDERFTLISQNFRHLKKMLRIKGIDQVDGILADLGISSYQVDTASRGFAHRMEGPLDMRMDKSVQLTAEDIVNSYDQARLQKIFSEYGEVRNARTLAQAITEARNENEIETTEELLTVISPVIRGGRNRYLSQVFQALRIEVNDELNALKEFLEQGKEVLKTGGRLAVITYHSLEDRIVKNFFRYGNTKGEPEKNFFGKEEKHFSIITKKPIEPSPREMKNNPRAHSARLRIAEKI